VGGAIAAGLAALPAAAQAAPAVAGIVPVPGMVSLPGAYLNDFAIDSGTDTAWLTVNSGASAGSHAILYGISLATGTITATVPLPGLINILTVDTDDHTVFAGDRADSSISVVDEATGTITQTIHLQLASGDSLLRLAYDGATRQLFAAEGAALAEGPVAGAAVAVINAADSVVTTIPLPGSGRVGVGGLAVDTVNGTLYVGAETTTSINPPGSTGSIVAISTATDTVTNTVTTPGTSADVVEVNGPASALYAETSAGLARYSTLGLAETGHVTLSDPEGLAINPATGNVYVMAQYGNSGAYYIAQVNAAATAVTAQTAVPDGLITVDEATSTVVTASLTTNKPLTTIRFLPLSATTRITSGASATFTTGKAGTFTVTASGALGPVVTETGKLPAGLTLGSTGILSGKPHSGTGGVYKVTLTASNGIGSPVTQKFTLTVDQAPAFTTGNRATLIHSKYHRITVRTTGYPTATVRESGKLPSGLTFRTAANGTATISGTPARSARGKTYTITLTATSKAGKATQRFTLKVT
jgi:hypothetical protein